MSRASTDRTASTASANRLRPFGLRMFCWRPGINGHRVPFDSAGGVVGSVERQRRAPCCRSTGGSPSRVARRPADRCWGGSCPYRACLAVLVPEQLSVGVGGELPDPQLAPSEPGSASASARRKLPPCSPRRSRPVPSGRLRHRPPTRLRASSTITDLPRRTDRPRRDETGHPGSHDDDVGLAGARGRPAAPLGGGSPPPHRPAPLPPRPRRAFPRQTADG